MCIEKENHLSLEDLQREGISIISADKDFGDAKNKSKLDVKKFFNINNKEIISGHQVHGTNIEIIKNIENLNFENTDGFITNLRNVALYTKYADCLPIFFFDRKNKVIGVVHSGWKGSLGNIGTQCIDLLFEHYNSHIEDIIIIFGVGISWKNYEVSQDFLEIFKKKFSFELLENSFFHKKGKIYFDNQKFNYLNFIKKGILSKNIITNNLCTFANKNFFSHRRGNKNNARNGAIIFFNSTL